MKKLLLGFLLLVFAGGVIFVDNKTRKAKQKKSYSSAAEMDSFCDRLPRAAYSAYVKHETSNDWFEVYEVEKNVWAIYEPFQWQEVISYLIIGTEKAVLFDTGNGIGDIKAIVEKLTDKPVQVLNSHSHFDHIGGNYQFGEILSVSTRFTLSNSVGLHSAQVTLEASPEALCNGLPKGVTHENHQIKPFAISKIVKDGDIIDLGGQKLEVLEIPGHTDDAIALLDRNSGFLWSGDSFYEGPIWMFFPETDLVAYQKSITRLAELVPELKAVFPAHNTPKTNPALLLELHKKLNLVLAGKITPTPVNDANVEFRFNGFSLLMREDYNRITVNQ